jgi:hypothetical protein
MSPVRNPHLWWHYNCFLNDRADVRPAPLDPPSEAHSSRRPDGVPGPVESGLTGCESKVSKLFISRAPYLATLVIGATEATAIREGMETRLAGREAKVLKVLKFLCSHFERLPFSGRGGAAGSGRGPGRCWSRDYRRGGSGGQGTEGLRIADFGLRIGLGIGDWGIRIGARAEAGGGGDVSTLY